MPEPIGYTVEQINKIQLSHIDLIRNHGDSHITQAAFNIYNSTALLEFVLVEACELVSNKLIGLSFATKVEDCYTYSVTVVHKDYRKRGIAKALEIKKRDTINKMGQTYVSQVHRTNESSIKLMKGVARKWYVSNDHYVFVMTPEWGFTFESIGELNARKK